MLKTKKLAKQSTRGSATGTYRYDVKLRKVVQVSEGVPKVASRGRASAGEMGPCGRPRSNCANSRCG